MLEYNYADVDCKHALDAPPATIPSFILVSSYQTDVVVCNEELKTIFLLELTCPFNSIADLTVVIKHKS